MRARLRARGGERPPDGSARPGKDPAAIPACCAWVWLRTSQARACEGQSSRGLPGIVVERRGKEGRLAKFLAHPGAGSICQHTSCQQQL